MSLDYFLPYQRAWITDDSPFSIGEKSRRIGWTYASSYRAVERRLRLTEQGKTRNLYFSSADLTAAKEFIDYCTTWARAANAIAEHGAVTDQTEVIDEDTITSLVLTFNNGAKIVAGSSNPKFFRSKGGDADGDEFAFHREPRELMKAMQPTSLFWGHQLRLWSTHNGEGNYFNQMIRKVRAGELKARLHRVTILDAVEQGLVEKIRGLKSRDETARREWLEEIRATVPDEDAWNEEFMCQPSSEQSSLLSYDLIGGCEAPVIALARSVADLPRDEPLYAGFDVGRKHDLSSLWVLRKIGDVFWTCFRQDLERQKFSVQEDVLSTLMANRAVRRLCMDASGIGLQMSERMVQRFGHRVEPVTFTAPVKSELAMPLLRLFQDKLVRIPTDPVVREDLHKIRKIVTAANNVRLDADRDEAGHADRFWALALAYHASDDDKIPLPAPLMRKPVGW